MLIDNLDGINSLEELSIGDTDEYKKLDNEFDLEKTKRYLYRISEPIELSFLESLKASFEDFYIFINNYIFGFHHK